MEDNFYTIYQKNLERLEEEVLLGTEEGIKEWNLYQEIEKMLGNRYFLKQEVVTKMSQLEELTKGKQTPFYQMMLERMKEDQKITEDSLYEEVFQGYGVLNEENLNKMVNYCKAQNEILDFKERFKLFQESDGWGKRALFGIKGAYCFMFYYSLMGIGCSWEFLNASVVYDEYMGYGFSHKNVFTVIAMGVFLIDFLKNEDLREPCVFETRRCLEFICDKKQLEWLASGMNMLGLKDLEEEVLEKMKHLSKVSERKLKKI